MTNTHFQNTNHLPNNFIVLGLNHHTAPLKMRERLAFDPKVLESSLKNLMSEAQLEEGAILSTCNRVEVYGVSQPQNDGFARIKAFLCHSSQVKPVHLEPHLYAYRSYEAVRHGFRVASSLDSMVIGETQITGQVKKAFEAAQASETSGSFLNRFASRALFVAKKVRRETGISLYPVSVGSVGVELAKRIFGDLTQKKVALVGAGKVGELVLQCLKECGVREVDLVNRSFEKARALSEQTHNKNTRIHGLKDLKKILSGADVVLTSLGGDEALINRPLVHEVMRERPDHVLLVIDLGVPRNVAPEVSEENQVYLYNIDDLKKVVETSLASRKAEALKAEVLVEKEASRFFESVINDEPAIKQLGKKFEQIRSREVEKTLKKYPHFSQSQVEAIEKCTGAIVNRILHDPALSLRSGELHERDWKAHDLLARIFKLDEDE